MRLAEELDAALTAVRAASRLTQAVRKGTAPGTLQKGDRSPVTIADFGSQAVVCRILQQRFPGDSVIAEEDAAALRRAENETKLARITELVGEIHQGATPGDVLSWIDRGNGGPENGRYWTLDPIDGTKGFLRGDQYAIALALIENGRPIVAALACPALPRGRSRGAVLSAVRGQGCLETSLEGENDSRARVSTVSDPVHARLSESVESGHSSHAASARVAEELGLAGDPRRMDSQAKYAVVARGEADIYMRLPVRPGYTERIWDHAAGSLVVEEAGGRVTDINGDPLNFGHGAMLRSNTGVVASNGLLHDAVLDVLARQGVAAV